MQLKETYTDALISFNNTNALNMDLVDRYDTPFLIKVDVEDFDTFAERVVLNYIDSKKEEYPEGTPLSAVVIVDNENNFKREIQDFYYVSNLKLCGTISFEDRYYALYLGII